MLVESIDFPKVSSAIHSKSSGFESRSILAVCTVYMETFSLTAVSTAKATEVKGSG